MAQDNNIQNQENTENNDTTNAKNNLQTSTAQTSQNQAGGSATAVKKAEETETTGGVVKGFYDKAKQSAGQVTEKAAEKLDEKKAVVTEGLTGVADSIRQVGENLRDSDAEENPIAKLTGKYGDALADQVEQISNYFDRKNVREIVGDVERFARRNPAIFIGGAFALGILAARFLKSSNPKRLSKAQGQDFAEEYYGDENRSGSESQAASNPS